MRIGDPGDSRSSKWPSIPPYEMLSVLGQGGQGTVYLAVDPRTGARVAIKVLYGAGGLDRDAVLRFRREAEVSAKLQHPGICSVLASDFDASPPWIAMRFVEGQSLARTLGAAGRPASSLAADSVSREPKHDTEFEPGSQPSSDRTKREAVNMACRLVAKIACALHAAHEAGILHRDIKPQNIMVGTDGEPVILDFGLARTEESDIASLTQTGDLLGTPAYMSPEQLTRKTLRIDRRTDLWSLGVILYEAVTGEHPFPAPTRQALYQAILTREPVNARRLNPSIPRSVQAIIETALQKDPLRRYQTASALASDLESAIAGRPVSVRIAGAPARLARWAKREPGWALLLVALLTSLPAIATLLTSQIANKPRVLAAEAEETFLKGENLIAEAYLDSLEGDGSVAISLFREAMALPGGSIDSVCGLLATLIATRDIASAKALLLAKGRELDGTAAHAAILADIRILDGTQGPTRISAEVQAKAVKPFDLHFLATRHIRMGHKGKGSESESHFSTAVAFARRAILRSERPRLAYYATLAHAAAHAKDKTSITESTESIRLLWPTSSEADRWLGLFQYESGAREESVASLESAIRLDPWRHSTRYELAFARYEAGDRDRALRESMELTHLAPDYLKPYVLASQIQLELSNLDEAIDVCERAIASKPGSRNPGLIAIYRDLARAHRRKGDLESARVAMAEAVRLDPRRADSHAELAFIQFQFGLEKEARKSVDEALSLDPKHALANGMLGKMLLGEGRLEEAENALRSAITALTRPNDRSTAHYDLGRLLEQKKLRGEAEQSYRRALLDNPSHAEANCNLAHILRRNGRFNQALEFMRRGHEAGSNLKKWTYPSAQWVDDCEKLVREEGRLLRVASGAESPTSPDDALTLAALASQTRRFALGFKLYEQTLRKVPTLAEDLQKDLRLAAARAALDAAGIWQFLTDARSVEARSLHIKSALNLIASDLDTRERLVREGSLKRSQLRRFAQRWLADPRFAMVDDPASEVASTDSGMAMWKDLSARLNELAKR